MIFTHIFAAWSLHSMTTYVKMIENMNAAIQMELKIAVKSSSKQQKEKTHLNQPKHFFHNSLKNSYK